MLIVSKYLAFIGGVMFICTESLHRCRPYPISRRAFTPLYSLSRRTYKSTISFFFCYIF